MTYSIQWMNDSRDSLFVQLQREMSYPTLETLADECAACLDAVDHPVRLIVDITLVRLAIRVEIAPLSRLARHRIMQHPNRLHCYLITSNGRVKVVLDMVTRLFALIGRNLTVVGSIAEAWQRIETERQHQAG